MKRTEAVNRIASIVRYMDLQVDEKGRVIQPSAEYLTSQIMELYDQLSDAFNMRGRVHWAPEDER